MLLYLIRHGKPDYATDSLTEEGWEQVFSYADTGHLYGQKSGPPIHYSSRKPY